MLREWAEDEHLSREVTASDRRRYIIYETTHSHRSLMYSEGCMRGGSSPHSAVRHRSIRNSSRPLRTVPERLEYRQIRTGTEEKRATQAPVNKLLITLGCFLSEWGWFIIFLWKNSKLRLFDTEMYYIIFQLLFQKALLKPILLRVPDIFWTSSHPKFHKLLNLCRRAIFSLLLPEKKRILRYKKNKNFFLL